ncbi:MAG: radical SAM family heme chaperone HemW [Ruminococcaceae bacterium]|nr:radical SAM family heme chaperone HemW [Oscillospiraceae bacterium]
MLHTSSAPKSSPEPLGVYLHIPFCKSKCPYCDFCSFPHPAPETVTAYVTRLVASVKAWGQACKGRPVDTVYFGGGTPTLLPPSEADLLLGAVFDSFSVLSDAEVTLECNPATADRACLSLWQKGGVNRLSMGAQSAHAGELKALGRLHTWADVCRTVEDARAVGIENINLDFMMGIPHQTRESLLKTLEMAVDLSPRHLSAYCLMLEEGTPFALRGAKALGLPDDDTVADLYEAAAHFLTGKGYEHYEISNFARPGYRSQHNLHTWQGRSYVGIGVAAHGYVNGVRYGNSRDLTAFLAGRDITEERVTVTPEDAALEAIMLGLRLSDGVDLDDLTSRYPLVLSQAFLPLCDQFEKQGLLRRRGQRIALTDKGFLVSNHVIGALLDACG